MLGSSSFAAESPVDGLNPLQGFHDPATLFIVAGDAVGAQAAGDAAALVGARVAGSSGFGDLPRPQDLPALDMILIEAAEASPDALESLLSWGRGIREGAGPRLVVSFAPEQLDQVAQALAEDVQLLCAPDTAERVAALAVAGRRQALRYPGATESESERLRRLSDEVARIAETLTRLTFAGANGHAQGRDGYAAEPETQGASRPDPDGGPQAAGDEPMPRPAAIRALIRARRLRAQFFDPQLFADPAWDMLLDLMAARLERVSVSVSSLCIAAAVPPTTALRWITTMVEAGLFEREDDPMDRRRAYIALTDKAFDGMRNYAAAVRRLGLRVF
ncbi:winged helix DNA-binding protein [Sphingomonas desiccabilis]|uniref:HTH marR-type domain-containing protein n=1 Tax=Sphingomonas desiccabilis TaxID=429134 RepID=A0A4Q2IM96_9SPHN|nr:winged helix DNA-binding protein [Sphingomonas desiccabilis]MBB3912280.1 hypothetical protein [Sphingomonas desiccabilis]RXZ30433.1 hypothetical protein EO081_14655 [Sphingomonas desiccabilis]